MAEPDAGTQLTLLAGTEAVDDAGLTGLYAYPAELSRCWVRSNFIASVDGGATADGKSGDLAGPGDRALFTLMRELCDVVVVGAGTARIENYGGAQLSAAARQARQARGQAEVPPIALVTRSGDLERDMKVFMNTEVPPLVLTSATAAPKAVDVLGELADVVDCSGADPTAVDPGVLLENLADRGLMRVLSEGGPHLHGTFMAAGLLDELCLSLAPILVGGKAGRIASGPGQMHTRMRRAHLLSDQEGYLYARYVRDI